MTIHIGVHKRPGNICGPNVLPLLSQRRRTQLQRRRIQLRRRTQPQASLDIQLILKPDNEPVLLFRTGTHPSVTGTHPYPFVAVADQKPTEQHWSTVR